MGVDPEAPYRFLKARARRLIWRGVAALALSALGIAVAWRTDVWWFLWAWGSLAGWNAAQLWHTIQTARRLGGIV